MKRSQLMNRRWLTPLALFLLVAALAIGLPSYNTYAADHLDAPILNSPTNSSVDINDIYVFQSPTNTSNTVLIMTVNPLAGTPNPTTFDPGAQYEFFIDKNGDSIRDGKIVASFGQPDAQDVQSVRIRSSGLGGLRGDGMTGQNFTMRSRIGGPSLGRVGVFDDPFFFDLNEFLNGLSNRLGPQDCEADPGVDFFAGLNVSAIVLEVPSNLLDSDSEIGVWARTRRGISVMDRMGRPAINTVFIPSNPFEPNEASLKDSFNRLPPFFDRRVFRNEIEDNLSVFYGEGNPTVGSIADLLLPDILTVDTANPGGFLNGRQLADDVIDAELNLVTASAVLTDCVSENDVDFSSTFPYLAPPHGTTSGN